MAGEKFRGRRRVHGRRQGRRLNTHQQRLMDELLPRLAIPLSAPHGLQPAALFDMPVTDVWLEIGFGGGEHLAAQARANGQIGMLGAEPYINGIAKLLSTIDREALGNIRIHPGDARELLEQLPDQCLGRVFILFPDPWPKTRHNKRRFISADNLAQIARVLRPGGRLRFASDITDYVRWTLVHVRAAGGFEWTATRAADWRQRPGDWPATRYEAKAIRQGRSPAYLEFIRL